MFADDPIHDGQTDAGALEHRSTVESFEYTEKLVLEARIEPHSIVANEDRGLTIFGLCSDGKDRDFSWPGVFERVRQQVVKHDVHQRHVAFGDRQW
jgi:hypothetical protein